MSDTATAPEVESLTAHDTCDRCGARAYLRVMLPTGGCLMFCMHHGDKHEAALTLAGATFPTDERHLLTD